MRPAVRRGFGKAMQCRTAELGAEVYSSENQELILPHTCKSRACPSCGYRAQVQWLRERWAALPNAPYKGITFTMPDLLWPLFRDNPPLAKALSALGAEVIKARVSAKYGVRVGVIAILHTFNGELKFNAHVHTMVTGGGLRGSSGAWVSRVYYEHDALMKSWRKAVIALLRAALRAGQLGTKMTVEEMEEMFTQKEKWSWIVKIQSFKDKCHFLQYAGRYVRRPPHCAASYHLDRRTNRQLLAAVVISAIMVSGQQVANGGSSPADIPYAQPGQLVSVNGFRLNLYCIGSGAPTVVFDSGWEDWAPAWSKVQPEVAKWTGLPLEDQPRAQAWGSGPVLCSHHFGNADGAVAEFPAYLSQKR
jgi:hypothetical protein